MKLTEEFDKDTIGPLLIESVVKLKMNEKENILGIISGKQSINNELFVTNIGDNIISIDFPGDKHELAEFIIESCDEFGYKTISNVYNEKINIRIIK